jgi:hypothetical protein
MRPTNLSLKRGLQLALLFLLVMTLLGADEDARFQNLGHKLTQIDVRLRMQPGVARMQSCGMSAVRWHAS